MKKYVALFPLIIMSMQNFAQLNADVLDKYWYYRHRLVNDYLIIGGERGHSIPAEIRGQ